MQRRPRLLSGPIAATALSVATLLSAGKARAEDAAACHPPLAAGAPHYVIGYGSLMETASKDRTWNNTGPNIPVIVSGFQRSWNARGRSIGFSTTFLGVRPRPGARMAAALYRVFDVAEFKPGDTREYIYCRVRVDRAQVRTLDGSSLPAAGNIWMYVVKPDSAKLPDARFPLIQSYVDLFLGGCMELAAQVVEKAIDFPAVCVSTTKGWSVHWVNDRLYPRRPQGRYAERIDILLHRMLPAQFGAIRLE